MGYTILTGATNKLETMIAINDLFFYPKNNVNFFPINKENYYLQVFSEDMPNNRAPVSSPKLSVRTMYTGLTAEPRVGFRAHHMFYASSIPSLI